VAGCVAVTRIGCDDRRMLPQRSLGASGPAVSVMSLGSWRTFERISRDEGLAVMRAAREAGVTLLDDARYDDETGQAPLPTGWSEVVFGELFRGAGWDRDAVTVCNKLWWEHWPREDAVAELDGSLGRMGLDHVDVIYAIAASTVPPVEVVVEQVAGLIRSGRAGAWGTGMWSGEQLTAALDVCDATGAPYPIAAQMACSLADHRQSGDPVVNAALERGGIGLVAAYALAGGTLTGKYASGGAGRAADDTSPVAGRGKRIGAELAGLAAEWGVPPAHLAFAYVFDHPHLATILFGATSAEQVRSNVAAFATYGSLDDAQRAAVAALA
jgi:aryl-alcohol dehydrogenase-like predicted oxidoreductase